MKNAAKIQRALLPAAPPEVDGFEVYAFSRPAGDVSGDFYDWQLNDQTLTFTVADVMGKGAGPAILAAAVQSRLRARKLPEPGLSLTAFSEQLDTDLALDDVFVTAFHANLDIETGTVRYSDAGHGIAHHITADGKITQLGASGPPLGIMPDYHWTTETFVLKPGDSLIIPSDGILELANDDIQQLQAELRNLTTQGLDTKASMKALINAPLHPTDDLTLLAIRRLA